MAQLTIQQAIQLALRHHHAGQLTEAEALYRQVLSAQPGNVDAMSLLGTLAARTGRQELAVELFRRAIAINPTVAEYHMHLGQALHEMGKFDGAAAAYSMGIALNPDYAAAYNNLGLALRQGGKPEEAVAAYSRALALTPDNVDALNNLGIALGDRGKLQEAAEAFERAIRINPAYAEAHCNLGNILKEQEKPDDAARAYATALALKDDYAEAHNNLGILLSDQGKLQDAIAEYGKATAINPGYAAAHYNLANTLRADGKLDEAIAAYRLAIQFKPDYPAAYNNLGAALCEQVKLDDAAGAYSAAIRHKPDFAEAHYNLGIVLREQGKLAEAIAAFGKAIELKPDYTAAHQSRGNALSAQGKLDEAVAAFSRVAELEPQNAQAYNALGNALKDQGKIAEAMTAYERAIALRPDVALHSNLVYAAHFHPGCDAAAIYSLARRWNRQHALPLAQRIEPHSNAPDPDRRLRIGYISPDMQMHPVGRFLLPLLSCHNHGPVEVFCYAAVRIPDGVTARLRSHADTWRSIVGMSDENVARLIRQDGIDILVELSLHTSRHRLLVLAQKPAPVQVTYLGYCSTSGMDTIDYRISDIFMDPPGQRDAHYSEETIRLPQTYWCYEPGLQTPPVSPLPALDCGHITFGCLNNFAKVSVPVLQTWCRLMQQVPQSRLVLSAKEGSHRKTVSEIMTRGTVDPARVIFTGRMPMLDYFRRYETIDIAVDPFPFAGGTTTCDALWMGVPMVTLAGRTAVGRAGVSLLTNVGLPELIARSESEYIRLAADLAGDLPRLAAIRAGLREKMTGSSVMDGPSFARNMEEAYRKMWRRWCQDRH